MKHTVLTEEAIEQACILLETAKQRYPELSYKQRTGKNRHGINLKYNDENMGSLWAVDLDGKVTFHLYTLFISDEDKAEAINLPKNSSRDKPTFIKEGKKVYVHQGDDPDYKWVCENLNEVKMQLEKTISLISNIDRKW